MTGLRRNELASLTPRSFQLDADPPTLTVEAAFSKHRRKDVLPLNPELVILLYDRLQGMKDDQHLFPKLAKLPLSQLVKRDLERVGIPYENAAGIHSTDSPSSLILPPSSFLLYPSRRRLASVFSP